MDGRTFESYLKDNDLIESLLIRFIYRSNSEQLDLVIDFAMTHDLQKYLATGIPPRPSFRDFRHFLFKGVINFEHAGKLTNLCKLSDQGLDYSKRVGPPIVIQDVSLTHAGNTQIAFSFGSHGRCKFNFSEVEVNSRIGRGEKSKEGVIYYDSKTEKTFDFYDPFELGLE
jgi:hypothetical protein